jgi:hypothetical protein
MIQLAVSRIYLNYMITYFTLLLQNLIRFAMFSLTKYNGKRVKGRRSYLDEEQSSNRIKGMGYRCGCA